ncbi:MAG: cyclodeaminase/cyclohydrolase family protein [Acidobacteriota bacterium]
MKQEKFVNCRIVDFTLKLASSDPTPGGGTAAALAGMLSASLLEMVARISLKKKPDHDALADVAAAMPAAAATLGDLMDQDSSAYDAVMAAFKLPKGTEIEKAARSAAIQQASIEAARVPMRTARTCSELLARLDAVSSDVLDSIRSDWTVARELARTGLIGGLANVDINIPSIKDQQVVSELKAEADTLRKQLAVVS